MTSWLPWVRDSRPEDVRRWLVIAIAAGGLVIAAVVGRFVVGLWASAASSCQVFEAGGMFGAAIFIWPGFTGLLWLALVGPVSLLRRRSVLLGVAGGAALVVVLSYWWLAGTSGMILSDIDGRTFCPTGVPDWWPDWAPQ